MKVVLAPSVFPSTEQGYDFRFEALTDEPMPNGDIRFSGLLVRTFGGGGMFTSNVRAKMNLHEWSGRALWKKTGQPGMNEADCPVCQAQLSKSLTAKDGLGDPTISEEGRRFLAGLMCQLTDAQIENLFKVAQVASMPEYHNSDGSFKQGLHEGTIERQWVEAFKAKREDLANGRCRWNKKPADLTLIDNRGASQRAQSLYGVASLRRS